MSDGFTLDTPGQILMGQWATRVSALAQKAGGGPAPRVAMAPGFVGRMAEVCGSQSRVSKGVLEDMVAWGYRNGWELTSVWSTVERGLGEARTAKLKRKCEKIRKELA